MALKWKKEWTNEYGITSYKSEVEGHPVGKHITRGGVVEYVWKGHSFNTEAELIARVKAEIGRKAPRAGSYNVTTMKSLANDDVDPDRVPVIVKAESADKAAKKGMVKLKLEEEGYQGYLLVTDHEGEGVAYYLSDSDSETSQFWRK